MTTLTTVCGIIPLALGLGDGAELMQPLALAVIGGLLMGMVLTLFIVPSTYLIVNEMKVGLVRWITRGGRETVREPQQPRLPERGPRRPEGGAPGLERA